MRELGGSQSDHRRAGDETRTLGRATLQTWHWVQLSWVENTNPAREIRREILQKFNFLLLLATTGKTCGNPALTVFEAGEWKLPNVVDSSEGSHDQEVFPHVDKWCPQFDFVCPEKRRSWLFWILIFRVSKMVSARNVSKFAESKFALKRVNDRNLILATHPTRFWSRSYSWMTSLFHTTRTAAFIRFSWRRNCGFTEPVRQRGNMSSIWDFSKIQW